MPGPHDALFRATFEKRENAAAELKRVLPPELVAMLDFTTLKVQPSHFVDDDLAKCESDLLLSVELGGTEALIYVLVEHQSYVSWAMPIRLLRYMTSAWERYMKEHPKARRVPPILPVVLHHSASGWTAATSLAPWVAVATQLEGDALRLVMSYILTVTEVDPAPIVDWAHQVSLQAQEAYVTAAEKIEQRARAKALAEGMAEGRRAVLSKQLTRRFGALPVSAQQLLREANEEQLDDWALRMLDAASLEQVFAT